MDAFKKILRYWLTLSSFIGFLVGWVFVSQSSESELADTNSATANTTNTSVVSSTLAPVPSIDSMINTTNSGQVGNVQTFTFTQSNNNNNSFSFFSQQPSMHTGGS
ncbi:MAG: hypothetical protein U0Z26_09395 [Anaerolineales bacterium]